MTVFRDPLDDVPAAVVAVGMDSRVTTWSRGAEELYGWTREQAVGRSVRELFLAGQQRTDIIAATHAGQVWEGEMPVVHRDGRSLTVHVRNAPLRDETGAVVGVLGISLDISGLHQAEQDRADVVADLAARATRAAARTQRLQSLTSALVATRTTREIADAVVDVGLAAVGAAAGALLLLSADRQLLVAEAVRGYGDDLPTTLTTIPVGADVPVAEVLRTGRTVLSSDRADWVTRYPHLPAIAPFGARAAVPVSTGNDVRGVLALSFDHERDFDGDDVELLLTIGRQCGQALERAALLVVERARGRRNAFLARAGQDLSRSLDLQATLAALTGLLVPDLAEWAVVHVTHDARTVSRATAHHSPDAAAALARLYQDTVLDPDRPGWASEAVRTGRSVLHRTVEGDAHRAMTLTPPDPDLTAQLTPTTGMAVPLLAGGRVVGALSLARRDGPAYVDEDVVLVEQLAAQAALAVLHAQDFEAERERALGLQRSLLPKNLPDPPGLSLRWHYQPGAEGALVGGDWYDVLPLPHGRVAVFIGDVMGSGVAAAAVMGQLRAMARVYAEMGLRPSELLRRLDETLPSLEQEAITTLLCAVVDPATRVATLASAGHLPPLLCRPGAAPVYLDLPPGPPLGAGPAGHPETRVELPPGSTLLLFTDGLVEDRHQSVGVGLDRLREAVGGSGDSEPAAVCRAALAGTRRDGGRADDTALLAVSFTGGPDDPFVSHVLAGPEDLPGVRRDVRRLTGDLPPEVGDDVLLLLTELGGNALLHAGAPVTVTVRRERDVVRVEVWDTRPDLLPLPSLDALVRSAGRLEDRELDAVLDALSDSGTTGRGMALVEGLTSGWGVEAEAEGKTVWCELPLHRDPERPTTEPAPDGVVVSLRALPVRLVLSSAASLDELAREFVVGSSPGHLADRGRELLAATSRTRDPFRAAAREALVRGQRLVDVQALTTRQTVRSLQRMQAVLDELELLARDGVLLAEVPDPEVRAFRLWWAGEIADQVSGAAPTPCPFPALPLGGS